MSNKETYWWRFEDVVYASSVDEYGDPTGPGTLTVRLLRFTVRKHTPKGVWVFNRFVRRDARKRYACPTVREAAQSYLARKRRQASIYRARLKRAEESQALLLKAQWETVRL